MAKKATTKLGFARRREKKTNYAKRLAMIKSGKPRLVVRKTNTSVKVQLITYSKTGDVTVASTVSKELTGYGWKESQKNMPAAYLTGLLCGTKATKKVNEAIADIGLHSPIHGSKIFAAVKGAIDAGIEIKVDEIALPKEDRLKGKHISDDVVKNFEETKEKIMKKVSKDAE